METRSRMNHNLCIMARHKLTKNHRIFKSRDLRDTSHAYQWDHHVLNIKNLEPRTMNFRQKFWTWIEFQVNRTGQCISLLGTVPSEILPGKRHITWVLGALLFSTEFQMEFHPRYIIIFLSYHTRPATYETDYWLVPTRLTSSQAY